MDAYFSTNAGINPLIRGSSIKGVLGKLNSVTPSPSYRNHIGTRCGAVFAVASQIIGSTLRRRSIGAW